MRTPKALEFKLKEALYHGGLLQPISSSSSAGAKHGHVELLCRQVPGKEASWIILLQHILQSMEHGHNVHICRRYLLKDGKLVFGWHIQLDSPNYKLLVESVQRLEKALSYPIPELQPVQRQAPQIDQRPVVQDPNFVPLLPEKSRSAPIRGRGAPPPIQRPTSSQSRPLAPGKHPENRMPPVRAPNEPGTVEGEPPPGFTPRLTVVESKGRDTIIEMPLPHVYRELNVPKNEKDKGARYIGGRGEE